MPTRRISFKIEPGRIHVLAGGKPFTTYVHLAEWDKPSLYPICSPSGTVLTRGFPASPRPDESTDHPWHRGIWYGHGDVNGHDFWRELGRDKTSRQIVTAAPEVQTMPPEIRAHISLQPPTGEPLGVMGQSYRFAAFADRFEIAVRITIHANRGVPLRFGDTDDGGFGFRLRDEFREDRGAELVNSEGQRGTDNMWGKAAEWIDYSALIDGARYGVAVYDHPSNLRHPTTWHARGYGLCSANPFGTRSFTGDADADGSYTLPAGERLAFRYTVVIYEGKRPAAELATMTREAFGALLGSRGSQSALLRG